MIAVVDYGAGNLRSVELALDRVGADHRRAATPSELEGASGVVLPGVGAAESAMRELEGRGLAERLRSPDAPLLGVCLGMQLLTETSDEGEAGSVRCLGLVPGRTRRFRPGVRLPQIGWNRVRLREDPLFRGLEREEWFYFLHGHRVVVEDRCTVGSATYGERFPAAIREGDVAGLQFHPEKSGTAGLRVLANFCASCERVRP